MKVLVLGGNRKSWRASERSHERDYTSGVEAWVFAFDGDYCQTLEATPDLIARYDLVIGNSNGGQYRQKLLRLQQGRKQSTRWVTLIEGGAIDYLEFDAQTKALFDASDLVNVINRHSTDFFKACTSAPCEYIGIPYPAAAIRERFLSGHRNDVWISSNLYHPRASCASALAAIPVTRKLGRATHGFMRPPPRKRGIMQLLPTFRTSKTPDIIYGDLVRDIEFHRAMHMSAYMQLLSETAYTFMNLDHRYTWSRDVLDCAALQIPCISTVSTGHAENYFPTLTVPNEFAVREASELLERLISDKEFYMECSQVPIERLEPLSHENMKRKLLAALN